MVAHGTTASFLPHNSYRTIIARFRKTIYFLGSGSTSSGIYLQAVVLAFRETGTLSYTHVAFKLAELLRQEYSVLKIVQISLPIIFVVYGFGLLLDRVAKRVTQTTSSLSLIDASCYAYGYSMLCLAVANLLPLMLNGVLPLHPTIGGVLEVTLPLPLWAKVIGVPVSLFGLFSAGHILVVAAHQIFVGSGSKWILVVLFLGGLFGVYCILVTVAAFTAVDPRKLVGADLKPKEPDHTNIFCRGRSLDAKPTGELQFVFTIENSSDEAIYVRRRGVSLLMTSQDVDVSRKKIRNIRIEQWSSGEAEVLAIMPKERAWAVLTAELPIDVVQFVATENKKVGGNSVTLKAVLFESVIHSNYVCNAQDADFPDKERPKIVVSQ